MESKKLYFDVDSAQIDIKSILKKEFLELKMRAISTANPNRNNSWFTKESLLASMDSFKNKPILGYFENGDFVSHNGEWKNDPEMDLGYWDTTEVKKGERPIGFIRESDEVKVIDDPDTGLSWIVLSCALWTQYNYKQVKRLLKDAKKAKQNGGPAKNISVEVDITDYEKLDNGVIKINAFNLVGITILGSRNGVKVEPGIAGAELSVVDIMGTEMYAKDMQNLRLAYEKLDGSGNNKKEEVSNMFVNDEENNVVNPTADSSSQEHFASQDPTETEPTTNDIDTVASTETPAETPTETPVETPAETDAAQEPVHQVNEAAKPEEGEPDDDDDDDDDDDEEDKGKTETEEAGCQEPVHQDNESQESIKDINWLLERLSGAAGSLECCLNYYTACADCIEGSDYIIPTLQRVYNQYIENEKELIGLMAKIAEGLKPEDVAEANELVTVYDCREQHKAYKALQEQFDTVTKQFEDMKAKIDEAEKAETHKKFMKDAKAAIKSAKFSDEIAISFEKDCEDGKINTLDELKTQIGLKLFEIASAEAPKEETPESFDAPVTTPNTQAFVGDGKTAKKGKWDTLRENNNN